MFGKRKSAAKPQANRLSFESEPNVLISEDAARTEELDEDLQDEFEDFDEEPDEDLDEDAEEDTEAAAKRAAELQAELQRQAEEYGLTSVDATMMYGPNGADVEELLETLNTVDMDTAELIVDAWDAVPTAERTVVRRVIQRRYQSGKLGEYAYNAEHSVDEWLVAKATDDDIELQLWRAVAEAARDAVDALVLNDKLDDVDFNTLYGPWAEVMNVDSEAAGDPEETVEEQAEEEAPAGTAGTAETAGKAAADGSEEGEFGPNTGIVLDLLDRLESVKPDQLTALAKAWAQTDKQALKVAHSGLEKAVKSERDWRDQVKAAQNEIAEWAAKRTWRQPAIPPLADAVAALVLADVLEPEDAETLYAPWAEVVGEPVLPAFEGTDDGGSDDENSRS
jgi:hypothetical protein